MIMDETAVNLSTVLTTIQVLMAEPNPDDGLMADIVSLTDSCMFNRSSDLTPKQTAEFKTNRSRFNAAARAHTLKHAVDGNNATLQARHL